MLLVLLGISAAAFTLDALGRRARARERARARHPAGPISHVRMVPRPEELN